MINPPIHPSWLAAINIKDLYYFYSIGYSIYSFLCFITFYHRFFDEFQIYWGHCYITLKVTIQNIVFYPNFCRTSLITIQIYLRECIMWKEKFPTARIIFYSRLITQLISFDLAKLRQVTDKMTMKIHPYITLLWANWNWEFWKD